MKKAIKVMVWYGFWKRDARHARILEAQCGVRPMFYNSLAPSILEGDSCRQIRGAGHFEAPECERE